MTEVKNLRNEIGLCDFVKQVDDGRRLIVIWKGCRLKNNFLIGRFPF